MRFSIAVAVACLSVVGVSTADPAQASIKRFTNIPAQALASALQQLAKERDFQIVCRADLVQGIDTQGLSGELTAGEAVGELLNGTGLTYRYLDEKTVTIEPAPVGPSSTPLRDSSSSPSGRVPAVEALGERGPVTENVSTGFWKKFRLAQSDEQARPADSVTAETENSNVKLEEVIVTATKRAEYVQDIPVSIAVISNLEIERRGLIGMEDYLRSVPGVNQIDQGAISNAIVIRGITTSPEFETGRSGVTVASYFDETSITGAGAGSVGMDLRPVDIERIEILRGPQGTTFGDASLGGAMRIIPVKPKFNGFSAKLAASYSNTDGFGSDNSMIQGIVNIPVVADKFALRAVGYRYDQSGYYKNIVGIDPASIALAEGFGLGDFVRGYVQDDVGRMRTTGGRLSALWQATDKLDLSMNFLTQRIEQDGAPNITPGVPGVGRYEQIELPVAPQGRVRGELGEAASNEMNLANLVLHYDFDWASLTSAASWIDSSAVNSTTVGLFNAFLATSATTPSDFRSFTVETRLASQLPGRFQFLGGVFYENVDTSIRYAWNWPGTPATNPFGTDPSFLIQGTNNLDQRAIFGEVSYDLTTKLTATVGGRYFKYKKKGNGVAEGGLLGIPLGTGVPEQSRGSNDQSSFKANLNYKPTNDSLLYASWGQGFRLGPPDTQGASPVNCDHDSDGIIDGTGVSLESTKHIDSDFLDNYEVGGKFALLDHRIVVDTAVYHIEWDGLPVTVTPFPLCGYDTNAGSATSDGAELQVSLFVVKGLRLDFGAGYTKAELSQSAPAQGWHKGDRLPGSPKLSANLAAQYDFDVAGHKAFVRADSFYTGKFYGDLQETPSLAAGDYAKFDARAGVALKNLSVELYVRNLTNEDALSWQSVSFGYRLQPRTVGLQLGYSFE